MYVCVCMFMCMYVYMCICVCMHVYIYIYIYIDIMFTIITINVYTCIKFVAQNIILSVLTNKPYEAESLCFYFDVPLCVCILLSV